MHLAKRVSKLQPSATLALSRQAQQLAQSGQDVIDLSIGQPDFTTPRVIKDAAISAINDGSASFYTPANGLPALREAISQHIYQQMVSLTHLIKSRLLTGQNTPWPVSSI